MNYSQKMFGNRIKSLRDSKGMTQEEIGEIMKVQRARISRIERGNVGRVDPGILVRVAKHMGVSIGYLITGEKTDDLPEWGKDAVSALESLSPEKREAALKMIKSLTVEDEVDKIMDIVSEMTPPQRKILQRTIRPDTSEASKPSKQSLSVAV